MMPEIEYLEKDDNGQYVPRETEAKNRRRQLAERCLVAFIGSLQLCEENGTNLIDVIVGLVDTLDEKLSEKEKS